MDDAMITAIATGLLVVVGLAQVGILESQRRQARLQLASAYRKRWQDCQEYWGRVIFLGRGSDEYYQVVSETSLRVFREDVRVARIGPTVWARDSVRIVCGIMSEVSLRLLQGQLQISDAYTVFGTEVLRHSRPLRKLLDPHYRDAYFDDGTSEDHLKVRREVQDWLIYHDGIRRRCLILIDLLWAEAARLEDLPPGDLRSAANAKKRTGILNRRRVFREAVRLNGVFRFSLAWKLSRFLRRAEYRALFNNAGINPRRLDSIEASWTELLLREYGEPRVPGSSGGQDDD